MYRLLIISLLVVADTAPTDDTTIDRSNWGHSHRGLPVDISNYPFIVSIRIEVINHKYQYMSYKHICGGSIIAKQWVVTAAHCLYNKSPDSIIVVAGTSSLDSPKIWYNSAGMIIHEQFHNKTTYKSKMKHDMMSPDTVNVVAGTRNPSSSGIVYNIEDMFYHEDYRDEDKTVNDKMQNDIGLIKIDREFEFSDFVRPITFDEPKTGETCYAAGWGTIEDEQRTDILRDVDVEIIDMETCKEKSKFHHLSKYYYFGPEQVCTWGNYGQGTCKGDSGGPLVCHGKLAGIVSYGVGGLCHFHYADIFTRAMAYAGWVQERTNVNVRVPSFE